ncbi:MAG: hypothetical protein A4E63_02775 [Syntrophorhabdus sp. PtaU1.Bin050]|nr:MAG: hypothetical protein A4E63_02775 [Syntrophorhabdus sp. PtaU1.Bin050]
MSEEFLNLVKVHAVLDKPRGEGVPEVVILIINIGYIFRDLLYNVNITTKLVVASVLINKKGRKKSSFK